MFETAERMKIYTYIKIILLKKWKVKNAKFNLIKTPDISICCNAMLWLITRRWKKEWPRETGGLGSRQRGGEAALPGSCNSPCGKAVGGGGGVQKGGHTHTHTHIHMHIRGVG